MNELSTSWTSAWTDLGLQSPPGLMAQLTQAYAEPQRHYHSLQHLSECMAHFASARHLAEHPGEVAVALWFHDAVYDVRGQDNEARSAAWAVSVLQSAGAGLAVQERVRQLILATKHDAVPVGADAQLLVDIDLAILGASPQRFAEYDAQVRREYAWVPGLVYRVKRRAVLKGFLARPFVYSTGYFRERLEAAARVNLAGAVG